MKILIDANVIMDYLVGRAPYSETAYKIVNLCACKDIDGFVAAHTITNLFYLLRKDYQTAERKEILLRICQIFEIADVDKQSVIKALRNDKFKDFEDCVQMECAISTGANYIVTRNIKDFEYSTVSVKEPKEFLELYHKENKRLE